MAPVMLPSSPSWYCSRIVDTNENGLLCFGAKHSIYILDTSVEPPNFQGHIAAHQDRVVGISFCHLSVNKTKICSAAEDGKVKIWDVTDKTLCGEHNEHKNKLASVHWSPADKDLIVSADERGEIIIWRPEAGQIRALAPEPDRIFSIACSPHSSNLIAVGYKNGQVLVLDISRKVGSPILHKLRGHEDEIHSIAWCPQTGLDLAWRKTETSQENQGALSEQQESTDQLLATGCRDKTVRVWSIEKGKAIQTLKLPHSTGQKRGWEDPAGRQRVWVTLYWPSNRPKELISSSFNGELLLWDLASPGKQRYQTFSGGSFRAHNRIVFNIASSGVKWQGLCSVSMDRQLIFWDADTLSTRHMIPSLGGFVYCIAQSPIHSGRLAIGVGDNLIRVWNVENSERPYNANTYWQGIKSKVTSVSWHPLKEGLLAFGTDDGKVGILDILASRSQTSSTYHKRTVYVVTWGPPCQTDDPPQSAYMLYSCGDGTVLQHNPARLDSDAIDINKFIAKTNNLQGRPPGRSEISWKPDNTVVALGNEEGSIDVFKAGSFKHICSVQVHRKLVNCVRWHPEYTAESTEPSSCQFWIASGSNEAVVLVTDLKNAIEAGSGENGGAVVITESFCQLEGHSNRITGLSWSSHSEGMLASASYDWTAQIWNVKKCEAVANYRNHHGRLLSVQWSALDPDLVYSGGDDFTIQSWHIAQQTNKAPPAGSEKKKHKHRHKASKDRHTNAGQSSSAAKAFVHKDVFISESHSAVSDGASNPVIEAGDMSEVQALLEKKREELLQSMQENNSITETDGVLHVPETEPSTEEGGHLDPSVSAHSYPKPVLDFSPSKRDMSKKEKDKTKRKVKSLFPLSSTMDNRGKLHTQGDCVDLIKAKSQGTTDAAEATEESYHLGHFLNRRTCYQLFDKEIDSHVEQGNWEQFTVLQMFKGDVTAGVTTLTEKQELSDFTVAMSALASPQRWRECCIAYSKQLEKDGNFPKAASYLLAAQQVYEAINLLRTNGHYKDAICLAQIRLSPDDPLINQLYSCWGKQLAADGNFELAAKCYIANGQPVEAARLIARRADTSALQVAAEICLESEHLSHAKVYCHKYTQQCMMDMDWASAAELVNRHPSLKLHGLLLASHQELLQQLSKLGYLKEFGVEQGDPYNTKRSAEGDTQTSLPWLLLDATDIKPWLPWKPYSIAGETFVHHLVRQWYDVWGLSLDIDVLCDLDKELLVLSQTRQTHTAVKQILIHISCNIAIAVIKLLLNHTEDAAYWLTVALDVCQENDMEDLWEGLCQLLLPTGPEHIVKLQHEIRALQLSGSKKLPSDLTEEHLKTYQHTTQSLVFHQAKPNCLNNDSQHCSALDCLQAFYYLRVAKFYLKEGDLEKSCVKQCHNAAESGAGDARSEVKSEEVERPNSLSSIMDMSSALLWDYQIKKLKFEEILNQIRKAAAALISQHASSKPVLSQSPLKLGVDTESEQSLTFPPTPKIGDVSLEDFKFENERIMSHSRNHSDILESESNESLKELSLKITSPQAKPHEQILLSPMKSPDKLSTVSTDPSLYMEMHGHDPMESIDENGISVSSTEQNNLKAEASEFPNVTPVFNLDPVADEIDSICDSVQPSSISQTEPINIPSAHDKISSCESEVSAVTSHSSRQYPDIPEEWYTLPIQEKYIQNYLNIMVLTAEQEWAQKNLTELDRTIKDIPFPNPEESAISLVNLCKRLKHTEDLAVLVNRMKEWGRNHCFSNKAIKFFTE